MKFETIFILSENILNHVIWIYFELGNLKSKI